MEITGCSLSPFKEGKVSEESLSGRSRNATSGRRASEKTRIRALDREMGALSMVEPQVEFDLDESARQAENWRQLLAKQERKDDRRAAKESKCPSGKTKIAKRMSRAKVWSPQVEENFRLQHCGWKDIYEYSNIHDEPDRWENGFIKCLRVKQTGNFIYWRQFKECENKLLGTVKLYEY